jgi:RNA polymerase sigma-70 factor (ECF subfamily)
VARTLSRYCSQPPVASDVDDLSQEVFEKLLRDKCRALHSVRGAATVDAWIMVIARNHTVDVLRGEGARARAHVRLRGQYADEELPIHGAPRPAEDHAAGDEAAAYVAQFLETLPAQQRLSMQLFYGEGMSYAEIAEVMGLPMNTVASHLHRARRRLLAGWKAQENESTTVLPTGEHHHAHG